MALDYTKNQPIIEVYRATQTEGSLAGRPHIIVRTTGCTHRCYFREGGWCDSFYTSITPEKGKFTLQDIKQFFADNWDISHLMLTGGSPTMHPELCNEIINLFKALHAKKGIVTMETEGSHPLITDHRIDVISLSPKFSNSVPVLGTKIINTEKIVDQKFIDQHNKFRGKYDAIRQLLAYHKNYHFKPVVNPVEQPEIWAEVESFRKRFNIPKHKTWLMPPGSDREELIRVYPMVLDFCTANAFNFSGRDHIIAYGDERNR
jgi:7-carboxy-7-deazaguanine synthase